MDKEKVKELYDILSTMGEGDYCPEEDIDESEQKRFDYWGGTENFEEYVINGFINNPNSFKGYIEGFIEFYNACMDFTWSSDSDNAYEEIKHKAKELIKELGILENTTKTVKVEMYIDVEDQAGIDAIKVWEHHVEYGIDTNNYPEIQSIYGVKVTEVEHGTVTAS